MSNTLKYPAHIAPLALPNAGRLEITLLHPATLNLPRASTGINGLDVLPPPQLRHMLMMRADRMLLNPSFKLLLLS